MTKFDPAFHFCRLTFIEEALKKAERPFALVRLDNPSDNLDYTAEQVLLGQRSAEWFDEQPGLTDANRSVERLTDGFAHVSFRSHAYNGVLYT